MSETFPLGSRVRLNAAGHARLGPTRRRDPGALGTVTGTEVRPAETRIVVLWDRPAYKESLPEKYLERFVP